MSTSKQQQSRLLSNIFKRFSGIFSSNKSSKVFPDSPDSNIFDPKSQTDLPPPTIPRNKISPFTDDTVANDGSSSISNMEFSKKTSVVSKKKAKNSLMFQSFKFNSGMEGDYELENEGVFNYKDKEEKNDLINQIQQILAKDDNEEDYKLAKLMKNDEDDGEAEIGMVDMWERECEKIEKLQLQHSCLFVQKKSPFELLDLFADEYPFLEFRKRVLLIKIWISFLSNKVIKHKFFRYFMFFIENTSTKVVSALVFLSSSHSLS